MSESTGLGAMEIALLSTIADAGPQERWHKSSAILTELDDRYGIGPRYAYLMLVDLVRPWLTPLPPLEGNGNFGSIGDDPAADSQYTECRLSPAGAMAIAAEREEGPPVPIGLVNGTTYKGGLAPPYHPDAVAAALLPDQNATDTDLVETVGAPFFPTGCEVAGDLAALAAGRRTRLRLTAKISVGQDRGMPVLDVTGFPADPGPDEAVRAISSRSRRLPESIARRHPGLVDNRLPFRDVQDLTSMRNGVLVRCFLDSSAEPEQAAERLREIWGVGVDLEVRLPMPLESLLRDWITRHGAKAAAEGARLLRDRPN
jgi:DNA gyrase/topoisomerase IV subunit A